MPAHLAQHLHFFIEKQCSQLRQLVCLEMSMYGPLPKFTKTKRTILPGSSTALV